MKLLAWFCLQTQVRGSQKSRKHLLRTLVDFEKKRRTKSQTLKVLYIIIYEKSKTNNPAIACRSSTSNLDSNSTSLFSARSFKR